MTRKRQSKETVHQISPTVKKPKFNFTQLAFTIISISIAIIGILFTYINYEKSLPQVHLEDWKIEILQPGDINRSNILFITADISNLGGSAASLVKPSLKIIYEDVLLTATPVSIILATPTAEQVLVPARKYSLVMEFPAGINDPKEVVCALKQTALLEFQDFGITPTPTSNSYTLNDKQLCFGEDDCRSISNDTLPSALAFSGDQQTIITNLISGDVTSDDTPIFIVPGETKRIFLTWYIPDSCSLPSSSRPKILDITLNFNNRQTIVINVMNKLKFAP